MTHPDGSDLELRSQLSRLPRSVEPSRDLWAGIEKELHTGPAQHRTSAARWAAAAGVAGLSLGILVMWPMQRGQAPRMAQNAAPSVAQQAVKSAKAMPGQPGYSFVPASTDAVRQRLQAQVVARLATLPPATRKKVEANLLLIKNAVSEIQSALAKDPGNSLLQELLVGTYQNEIDTLVRVQTLAQMSHTEVSI